MSIFRGRTLLAGLLGGCVGAATSLYSEIVSLVAPATYTCPATKYLPEGAELERCWSTRLGEVYEFSARASKDDFDTFLEAFNQSEPEIALVPVAVNPTPFAFYRGDRKISVRAELEDGVMTFNYRKL